MQAVKPWEDIRRNWSQSVARPKVVPGPSEVMHMALLLFDSNLRQAKAAKRKGHVMKIHEICWSMLARGASAKVCSRFGLRKVSFPHALEGMPMGQLELLRLRKSAVLQSVGPQQKHPILCLRGKFSLSFSLFLSFLCHRSLCFFETFLNKSHWKWLQSFDSFSGSVASEIFVPFFGSRRTPACPQRSVG